MITADILPHIHRLLEDADFENDHLRWNLQMANRSNSNLLGMIADLATEVKCLRAAAGELPLSVRQAVERRDVTACAAWAKQTNDFIAGLQAEIQRLTLLLKTPE